MRAKWAKWIAGGLLGGWLLLCAGWSSPACAATAGVGGELQALAGRSSTIFVGQIISIQRHGGFVEVCFRVEQPVRGSAGRVFAMREWAGLWPRGSSRYTVGQRVLAFVHGTSATGLSSPVHGAEGLVPVAVQGANAPKLLDVRRVAASVIRAPGEPLADEQTGAMQLADALTLIQGTGTGGELEPVRVPVPVRGRPPVTPEPGVPSEQHRTTPGESHRRLLLDGPAAVEGVSDAQR